MNFIHTDTRTMQSFQRLYIWRASKSCSWLACFFKVCKHFNALRRSNILFIVAVNSYVWKNYEKQGNALSAPSPAWSTIFLHRNCLFSGIKSRLNANLDYNLSLCPFISVQQNGWLSNKYPNLYIYTIRKIFSFILRILEKSDVFTKIREIN